jgi:hydrogenase nickel incorporation protein HypA/HybF
MHEMGIAIQIVDIAKSSIPEKLEGVPVERVNIAVGKMSAIVPSSLKFCFDIAIKETPLEGAVLHIEELPVILRCNTCNYKWTADQPLFTCEKCQHNSVEILSGRELDILSIELAQDQD